MTKMCYVLISHLGCSVHSMGVFSVVVVGLLENLKVNSRQDVLYNMMMKCILFDVEMGHLEPENEDHSCNWLYVCHMTKYFLT